MLNDEREELFVEDGLNSWESSRLRIASLPDNLFSRRIAERLLRNKTLNTYRRHEHPTSRTYHFEPARSFANDDSDTDNTDTAYSCRELEYSWDGCGTGHSVTNLDTRKYRRYCQDNT